MSFDYSRLALTAVSQIKRFGRDMTKRTKTNTGTAYDPNYAIVDTPIRAVVETFTTAEINDTTIQTGDKRILTTTEISKNDDIVDGSEVYSVINVEEIKPGDTALLYIIQARR